MATRQVDTLYLQIAYTQNHSLDGKFTERDVAREYCDFPIVVAKGLKTMGKCMTWFNLDLIVWHQQYEQHYQTLCILHAYCMYTQRDDGNHVHIFCKTLRLTACRCLKLKLNKIWRPGFVICRQNHQVITISWQYLGRWYSETSVQ